MPDSFVNVKKLGHIRDSNHLSTLKKDPNLKSPAGDIPYYARNSKNRVKLPWITMHTALKMLKNRQIWDLRQSCPIKKDSEIKMKPISEIWC